MILSEKITILRKQNGWSQEELAEKLGISRQSVSKWESAASLPDLDKIIKMSAIFNVSTDYLCLCLMLLMISCSVFLLVWSSGMTRGFQKLLRRESDSAQTRRTPVSRIYWCIVTAVFLAALLFLLYTNRDAAIALLIWPVAGVLFPAIKGIAS